MKTKLIQTIPLVIFIFVISIFVKPIANSHASQEEDKKTERPSANGSPKKNRQQQEGFNQESATDFIKRIGFVKRQPNNYTTIASDLFEKLQKKQYSEVEKYFDILLETKEKANDGTHLIYYIYNELASNYLDPGFDVFDEWCKNSNHHSAFIIRAGYYINNGWRDRGHGYAHSVSSSQFKRFHKKLSLAYDDLIKAYEYNQKNPLIPMAMLQLAKGNSLAKQQLKEWYEVGVGIDPSFYWIYKQYYNAILPKWGGTLGESDSFLKKITANPPAKSLVYTLKFDQISDILRRKRYSLTKEEYEYFFSLLEGVVNQFKLDVPNSNKFKIKLLKLKGWCNQRKNPKLAAMQFKNALELNPTDDLAWYGLADTYGDKPKDLSDAMAYYNKAIELNPDEGWYYPNRGITAFRLRSFDQCISDFSFAINNGYGNSSRYYTCRGRCYKDKEQSNANNIGFEKALNDFNKAIELDPSNKSVFPYRANVYAKLELYQMAINDYNIIIQANPQSEYYLSIRALMYSKINDFKNAIADIEKILLLNPNHAWARENLPIYKKKMEQKTD